MTKAVILFPMLVASCGLGRDETPPQVTRQASPQPVAQQPVPVPTQSPTQPGNQGAAGQTIELPGLGSVTLNIPAITGSPDAGRGSTGGSKRLAMVPPSPPPPAAVTPSGSFTDAFLQSEARAIHAALLTALPEAQRSRVAAIPLDIVDERREPNAAASCSRATKRAVMLITTGMLTLSAGIAETRAYDEVASSQTYDSYARTLVDQLRARQPVSGVPAGLVAGPLARDQRKLARQLQLFEEQVAFILAHELAHHHRGHTGCVGSGEPGRADAEDLLRIASSAIPTFTQPLEVESDTWAVYNVLTAGHGRQSGSWDEEGGLLNLDFFGRLRELGGVDILRVFLSTHPLPQIRRPIIQVAAQGWEPGRWPPGGPDTSSGLPIPGGTLPIQIPGLTTR